MKTLTLVFDIANEVELRCKGLNLSCDTYPVDLIINDKGKYALWVRDYHLNGDTVRIEEKTLIQALKSLLGDLEFTKVKVVGAYELTGEEILNKIKE